MEATFESIKKVILGSDIDGDIAALEPDTSFESVGVDSLDTFNILLAVEESFDVKIPEEQAENFNTIAKLVAFVKAAA